MGANDPVLELLVNVPIEDVPKRRAQFERVGCSVIVQEHAPGKFALAAARCPKPE